MPRHQRANESLPRKTRLLAASSPMFDRRWLILFASLALFVFLVGAWRINGLDDLTIIRLDQRKEAFDEVMNALDADAIKARRHSRNQDKEANRPSEEFFSGNISSLLDVVSDVRRIEIKRRAASNHLHEEIEFLLK